MPSSLPGGLFMMIVTVTAKTFFGPHVHYGQAALGRKDPSLNKIQETKHKILINLTKRRSSFKRGLAGKRIFVRNRSYGWYFIIIKAAVGVFFTGLEMIIVISS